MSSTSYYGGGRLNFTGGGYVGGNMSGGGLISQARKTQIKKNFIHLMSPNAIIDGGSTSYYGGGDNTTGGSTSYYGGTNMSGGKRGGKTSGTGNTAFMEWVNWKKATYPNGGYTKAEVSKAWAAHKKKMGIKTKK